MRLSLWLLCLCFCISIAFAQTPVPTQFDLDIQKAKSAFNNKKYNTAAGLYKKLYNKIKEEELQNEMLYWVAESYRRSNNFKEAFNWYEKLVNTKYPDVRIIYSYGLLLKNFERYEEAARQFGDYLFEVPGDPNALRELWACKQAQQWKANPKKLDIQEQQELNTEFSDYAPMYNQRKLIWASSRKEATGTEIFEWTGQKCSDFFESSLTNGNWGPVAGMKGGINTAFNDGAGWIDSTESTFYFTQCNGIDGKGVNCKIYVSYKQNNEWSAPKVLPFCSDSFSVGHPAMSPDGKRLFFASDMPGGFGEKDIYYIPYKSFNDTWGNPVNLGPNVNTPEDDMFPHVDAEGTIYFASKGWVGMGGLDLFQTADSAQTFKKAKNMESPVNSGGDDFGISFVPKNERLSPIGPIAYLSSNKPGGKGDDDLYALYIKPYIFRVSGVVTDQETGLPIPSARVIVKDTSQQTPITIQTNEKGAYSTEIPLNKELSLYSQKDKYFASAIQQVSTMGLTQDSMLIIDFKLSAIPADDYEFTLKGIYYNLDKWDIRPDAAKVLDSLASILRNNPSITIELASHTDSRADEDYNLKLSQKRAQSCVDYLVKKGIAKERLTAVGYGESHLINDCADGVDCTEEQHQENRRTTFRVLSTDFKKRR